MSQKKNKALRRQQKTVVDVPANVIDNNLGFIKIIKDNWKFLVVLCVGIFVLYLNSLHGDFVSDDYASITQNPDIANLGVMSKTRDVSIIANSVVSIIFGIKSSLPFHSFNLILYLLICVAAFVLVFLVMKNKTVSMLTLILYAALPVHAEVIAWISGRPYLFVALFILLSLDLLILYLNKKQKKYLAYILIVLLFLFLTDRIRGFAIVFLGLLYFLTFKKKLNYNIKLEKIFISLMVVVVVLLVFSWKMIQNRIGSVNGGYNGSGSIFYNPFFQYPTAIPKYLQLVFVPTDLTLYHTMFVLPVILNWSILLVFIGNLIYFFSKDKIIFFALAFIFLAAAPSMAPVKVSWLVAERYIFLGSLGFCLALVLVFEPLFKKYKFILLFLFTGLVLIYGIRVYFRNIDWQTNHNLWVRTVQVSPNSHNAWNNIGDDYDKLGQPENAVKGFSQSTIVKPDYADAYHNRANIFYKMGRLDLARDSYNTALHYSPGLYQTYLSLIQIDLMEKRLDLAMEHGNFIVKLQPYSGQAHYVMGFILAQAGQKENAIKELEISVQLNPNMKPTVDLLNQLKGL
jgi:tetratricopeptide (TPR) repeat protein